MENKLRRSFKFIRTRPCVPTVHNIPFKKQEENGKKINESMPTTQYWFLGENEGEGTKL